jgi:AcrR family transcriptional regulator
MAASQTARARVRAEITAEIMAAAHEELARVGASALSLRAVARRLEMVPSALYRYFDSRDALLTALIIDAYRSIGAVARSAATGSDPMARWLSTAAAVRAWARDHPHEWALVYGSPVPGYQAPQETVEAALEITTVMADIVCSAAPTAPLLPVDAPPGLALVLEPIETLLFPGFPPELVVAALMAWTQLIGMISLELFGHYKGATTDFDRVFAYAMELAGAAAGITR